MARRAHSLQTLLNQVNTMAPNRNKASDGWIADSNHAATSDHQPNAQGIVTAQDITNDPSNGMDAQKLANALVASGDSRIKYLIFNRRIWEGGWKTYSGTNPHDKHIHISVKGDYDNPKEWLIKEDNMQPITPSELNDLIGALQGRKATEEDHRNWDGKPFHTTYKAWYADGRTFQYADKCFKAINADHQVTVDGVKYGKE